VATVFDTIGVFGQTKTTPPRRLPENGSPPKFQVVRTVRRSPVRDGNPTADTRPESLCTARQAGTLAARSHAWQLVWMRTLEH
jgi:hypothetical protein